MKKYLLSASLGLSLVACPASLILASSQCQDDTILHPLANNLARGDKTVMVLANDYETDPDSNLAGIVAVGLAVKAHVQAGAQTPLGVIVYTDDEYTAQDALNLSAQLAASGPWDADMPLAKAHYTDPLTVAFLKTLPATLGLRAQDAAVDFFSLANFLNTHFGRNVVDLHVVQGTRTRTTDTKEPYVNPYLGNFGMGYDESAQTLISQIHPTYGAHGVLELLQGRYQTHKAFLLSGGSARLSLDLAEQAPELTQHIPNISVIGRIETPHSTLFNRQEKRPGGSWNARIDPSAFTGFFQSVADNPTLYESLHVVDSGTIFYAPVFDAAEGHMPHYAQGLEVLGYDAFLPKAALESKNMVEKLHTEFAWGYKPKAMDPVSVLYGLGLVDLSMRQGTWQHIYHQFAPQDTDAAADIKGIHMSLPWTDHGHPFVSTFPGRGESEEAFAARLATYAETGYEHTTVVEAGKALKANVLRELLGFGAMIKDLAKA